MVFEMTIGLKVIDHDMYARYRVAIAPLLEQAGGRFRYDFEVARTLKAEAAHVMPNGDTAGARGAAIEALKLARQGGLA